LKSIRISLPDLQYIRYLYYSFIKLVDTDKAEVRVLDKAVELVAKGDDIRPVLRSTIMHAVELGRDYKERKFGSDFPLSGNDKKIFKELLNELGLSGNNINMLKALEEYAETIIKIDGNELKSAFESYSTRLSPLQAFLLETYSLTRAPFFDSKYEHKPKMNLHQMMICSAGYIAARCSRSRIGEDAVAVLVLPLNLKVTRYDFYKNIREIVKELPGMSPEEAVILWIALHIPNDFSEDMLILCVKEPGQSIQLVSSITVSSDLLLRATRLNTLREKGEYVVERLKMLLRDALTKGARPKPEIDDAIEYVKLLYLAVQEGYENEILELALRSSRREASLASANSNDVVRRRRIATSARLISDILLKEIMNRKR